MNQADIIAAMQVLPEIDVDFEIRRRIDFIRYQLELSGQKTLVLGIMGGVVGLILAVISTNVFVAATNSIQKPYWIEMRTDGLALAFTAAITLLAALAAGTLPALRAKSLYLRDSTGRCL